VLDDAHKAAGGADQMVTIDPKKDPVAYELAEKALAGTITDSELRDLERWLSEKGAAKAAKNADAFKASFCPEKPNPMKGAFK
jgi:hypothetical protein